MIKDSQGNVRFFGIYRGIVTDNQDPLNRGRLRLQVPQVLGREITGWAWANHRPGIANVTIPIGTPVWAMFEGGDPSFPMWVGMTADQITGVPVPVTGDLIPDIDDAYRLGTAEKRWKSLQLGPGTLYIEDTVTHEQVGIGVTDGSLTIDGATRIQIGDMKVTTAGLTFPDDTEQTTAYIPPSDTSFVVTGGTTGTQPTFSGSPLFTGSYTKIGDQVHFQIQVDMDNITGFGTGQYYLDLPFPSKYPYKFRDGCLHDISASKDYAIGGHVAAGASRMYLFSTDTQSGTVFDIEFDYNSPVTLATADNFHIAGTYIADEE